MPKIEAPMDEDFALADKVMAWLESLQERADNGEELSDYLHNLCVFSRAGVVNARGMGIMASAVMAYKRETEEKLAGKEKVSLHVGAVKDKVEFKVRLLKIIELESQFGVTKLHKFEVIEGPFAGAALTWFGSKYLDKVGTFAEPAAYPYETHEEGDEFYIAGTIKALDEYKGVKQTTLTRVDSVYSPADRELFAARVKEEKKAAAKAKREAKKAEKLAGKVAQEVQDKTA